MPYCFAPGCNHVSRRETCKFFRFPVKCKTTFRKWKTICRRKDRNPTGEDRLCSCHFIDGDKENLPTIFAHCKQTFGFPSPPQRKIANDKKVSLENVCVETETATEPDKLEFVPNRGKDSNTTLQEIDSVLMTSEKYFLHKENHMLKELHGKGENRLSFESLKSDLQVFQYTGLPTAVHFQILVDLLKRFDVNYFMGWKVVVLNMEDQLLCTLMKLRLDLQNFDLAFRFKISSTTVQNIFLTFVHVLHEVLVKGMMDKIPSREKNTVSLPMCFIGFPNIKIVLDCTEIEVAIPSTLKEKKTVFSHYKQRHTFKVFIGIAPNGTITYVSEMYPGSSSDKAITSDCGILSHMMAGDLLLCDKGFLISDLCTPLGVHVNIPPLLTTPQFTREQVLTTRKIARARIHVERAISRLKSFRILDFIMPNMRLHATTIVQTCAALVNMQYTLLKENEQCFNDENIESR